MYPEPPYPGCTWPVTQHMGVITERNLYQILLAAATFAITADPPARINDYIVANGLFTPNVRADTGQPDAWRDYQQVLSELSLIYSTKIVMPITLTPLGLAFLDKSLSFGETVTLQALRYQYPNGHKMVIDQGLRPLLAGTAFERCATLPEVQMAAGMQLRPGVLVWQVLRELQQRGEQPILSVDEIQTYLMRCTAHADAAACADSIVAGRRNLAALPPMTRGRRNAQDWVKFLLLTPLFEGNTGANARVWLSDYALRETAAVDGICNTLADPATFWIPRQLDPAGRIEWYTRFGQVDLALSSVPELPEDAATVQVDESEEARDTLEVGDKVVTTDMHLRPFDPNAFGAAQGAAQGGQNSTIDSSYDARLTREARKLHDRMVLLIGNICREKTQRVWDDPDSVDLLAEYDGWEFLVEVKTVTPRNFVIRLRYALGQLHQYDYLRSAQPAAVTPGRRRKVVALAAYVPRDMWCVPFLNGFLDFDLLSLEGRTIRVDSPSLVARRLFTAQ